MSTGNKGAVHLQSKQILKEKLLLSFIIRINLCLNELMKYIKLVIMKQENYTKVFNSLSSFLQHPKLLILDSAPNIADRNRSSN